MSRSSLTAVVIIALFVIASIPPTVAEGPIVPTIAGLLSIPAQRPHRYSGQLMTSATGHAVPLIDQRVDVYVDGAHATFGTTDGLGRYLVNLQIATLGSHQVQAVYNVGTPLEGRSENLTVNVYATIPTQVANFTVAHGFYYWQTDVNWSVPLSTGGLPIIEYRLYRSVDGSPYSLYHATPSNTSFLDEDVVPGHVYLYRIQAENALGTSKNATAGRTALINVTTVDVREYWVCLDGNCTLVAPHASYTAPPGTILNVTLKIGGIVDEFPVSPPGHAGVPVLGFVRSPAQSLDRIFTWGSGAGGLWERNVSGFEGYVPAGGCETQPFDAFARIEGQGHTAHGSDVTFCAA